MKVNVRGHNVEVTDALKQYATEKTEKIGKFFDNIQDTIVELTFNHTSEKTKRQVAQITSWVAGSVVRAEEASEDMYASIDLAIEKIERQLKKYKEKLHDKHRKEAAEGKSFLSEIAHSEEHRPLIVRTKQFSVKPMTPEEACLQMQLIDHDFFLFKNVETGLANVIYKRKDGNFGLLETEA
jgi:putative sigma-54 modulation protein